MTRRDVLAVISHRLVTMSGEAQIYGWLLPGAELEEKAGELVRRMISAPGFAAMLLPYPATDRIAWAADAFCAIAEKETRNPVLELIARLDIALGKIEVQVDAKAIADVIDIDAGELAKEAFSATFPFQLRKRGVETKIIRANDPTAVDEVLVHNIALAHAWFERIKAGESFFEIAETEAKSRRRIQQMIGLAFLAPDIVRDVMDGTQPLGFTSDWCLRHDIPSDWQTSAR